METKGFTISWGGLWRVFFMLLLGWVLFLALDVFVALFLAIVISSALDPVVSWLERKKIPRILGTLAIYIVAIFLLALLIYAVVPIALSELNSLINSLSVYIAEAPLDFIDVSDISEWVGVFNESLNKISNILLSGGRSLVDITSKFLGGVIFTVSIFVLSFYLTVGRDGVERFLMTILPTAYEEKTIDLYARIRKKIGRWLGGQLLLSAAVGTLVFLGLWLLGVKYSLILGIIAGIFELIPYVGPIFSGSLAVLVALTDSLALGLYVLLLFIIIQQLENNIFVPAVMSLTTSLDPVVILIALLIGAQVFGFIGLILAVPAAVLLQELVEGWSEAKRRSQTAAS